MSDWYTPELEKALKIVPVEWDDPRDNHWRFLGERDGVLFAGFSGYGEASTWECGRELGDFEAQALIEKALREWLMSHAGGHSVSGAYNGHWLAWSYDGVCETVDLSDEPTHIAALAAAVLTVHGEETE